MLTGSTLFSYALPIEFHKYFRKNSESLIETKMKRKRNEAKQKLNRVKLDLPCNLPTLRFYVNRYTGRKLTTDRALRYWFDWCEVDSKPEYDWSDLAKLVVFGNFLNQYASFEWAQTKLIEEIVGDREWFFPSQSVVEGFVDESNLVQITNFEVIPA